jgi:DNA-binding HxlR family transcriptional regulator
MNAPRSGCPINLTLESLGDRWSLIVIRDLMVGDRRRFRELSTRSGERNDPGSRVFGARLC